MHNDKKEFKKILIANRGEIALRVIRTCKEMGIKTVAVYSTADADSLHVRFADEAVCIGPASSKESYLNVPRIMAAVEITNADAVHPGYGFLAENADFCEICTAYGIKFIGPTPEQIRAMGDKITAKETMIRAGVPVVPGSDGLVTDLKAGLKTAQEIGYPVIIKATAGGGGKGMRVVWKEEDFENNLNMARTEAKASFTNDGVYIEKFVEEPRHIEFQIAGDRYGTVCHLSERDCSIQRRHQKLVEEAPSSILSESIREKMCADAVKVALACNYSGAGTVEFLIDDKLNYYFLEMNTRLQVEHPVTEYITGLDLVEQQIRVARNEKLSFSQKDLKIHGHAIELRVCAEDPLNNFLPSVGTLTKYESPTDLPFTRIDDGYKQGMEIPVYYDPMIAKLICWGATRAEAIQRLIDAIDNFHIEGIATTLPFGKFVLQHEAFTSGKFDTGFVKNYYEPEFLTKTDEANIAAKFALAFYLKKKKKLVVPA